MCISVYDRVKPKSIMTLEGDSVEFTCDSKGNMTWFKNGSGVILSKSSNLSIQHVEFKHDGNYICRGTTEQGDLFEGRTLLIVVGMLINVLLHILISVPRQ